MASKKANPHIGSDFEDFLREEGGLRVSTVVAVNRVKAWQKRGKLAARFPQGIGVTKRGSSPGGSD